MKLLVKKISSISEKEKKSAIIKYNITNKNDETICGRVLLSKLTDIDDEIIYNENGKPYFKNSKIYFSISHSSEYVACIVSDNEIGIDIQKIRRIPDNLNIVFNEDELELSSFELLKLWTKKEAIIKARGLNMQHMKKINIEDYNLTTEIFDKNYIISICEIV